MRHDGNVALCPSPRITNKEYVAPVGIGGRTSRSTVSETYSVAKATTSPTLATIPGAKPVPLTTQYPAGAAESMIVTSVGVHSSFVITTSAIVGPGSGLDVADTNSVTLRSLSTKFPAVSRTTALPKYTVDPLKYTCRHTAPTEPKSNDAFDVGTMDDVGYIDDGVVRTAHEMSVAETS